MNKAIKHIYNDITGFWLITKPLVKVTNKFNFCYETQ